MKRPREGLRQKRARNAETRESRQEANPDCLPVTRGEAHGGQSDVGRADTGRTARSAAVDRCTQQEPAREYSNDRQHDEQTWLKMLAEAGLPGLFIMLTVIAVLTRRLLLCAAFDRREARGAARVSAPNVRPADMRLAARDREAIGVGFLAALAGFCVAGTFLTQAFTWPFYVLVALASAYCTLTERPLADPSRRLLPAARQ